MMKNSNKGGEGVDNEVCAVMEDFGREEGGAF